MKVKISYTVDLDEVPDKSAELIDKVFDELEQTRWIIENISKKLQEGKDILLSISELEELAERLAANSFKIEEVASILKGYLQVKTNDSVDYHPGDDYILDEEEPNSNENIVE